MDNLKKETLALQKYIPKSKKDLPTFLTLLYATELLVHFDWMKEMTQEDITRTDFNALDDALLLRKLLTAHVRADRFNEGHLIEFCLSGKMSSLLNRLAAVL